MSKVIISADSTCDLSPELVERYAVHVIPLHVMLGENAYFDGVDVNAADIYAYYDEYKALPTTAAINIDEYTAFFKELLAEGDSVVHICTGSAISSCCQNARIAAEEVGDVCVVDSLNLSTGMGLQVIAAAEKAQAGMTAAQIAAEVEALRPHCHASFILDTLEYLYKGGRCSALAMFGANVLKLRPAIQVDPATGAMGVGKKHRGTLERAMEEYIRDELTGKEFLTDHVFFTHSGLTPERVALGVELVKKYGKFKEIHITQAGSTISSHCGPNCLGVLYFTKPGT